VRLSIELADTHEKTGDAEASARALERRLEADAQSASLRARLRSKE
jgi:hypothetical protein